ncbi:MAG: hypothetical protein ACYCUF_11755, partial [Acidimicrobiales bacterium]
STPGASARPLPERPDPARSLGAAVGEVGATRALHLQAYDRMAGALLARRGVRDPSCSAR